MKKESRIAATNLTVTYDQIDRLKGVTLQAQGGQLIGLIGPNGAGKTTLLKTLAGLIQPDKGAVAIDGQTLEVWRRDRLARTVGYLSQTRTVHWPVTVERLVSLGRLPHRGPWDRLSNDDQQVIAYALTATDTESLRERNVTTLSGGELARVLLARVLAGAPKVILADEPVSGLDPGHRIQVVKRFQDLAKRGHLVIVVMHDLTMASLYCDRLILLNEGEVVADGSPKDVLSPERLRDVYHVDTRVIADGEQSALVPWDHV